MAEHEFETLDSETVFVGNIFAVRTDEVSMPNDTTARRDVIEHYGAVAVAALDDDGKIVLVYQYRHALGRRLWELPAGLLDVGGEAPELTAARELEEEVGLAAGHWSVLVDLASTPGFTDESVRVFLASGLTEIGRPEADHEEADMTVERFALADAVQMVFRGEIVNATTVAGILAVQAVHQGLAELRPVNAPWPDRPTKFAQRRAARDGS